MRCHCIVLLTMFLTLAATAQQRSDRRSNDGEARTSDRGETRADGAAAGSGYAAEFGVLSDRNIFLRERARPRQGAGVSNGAGATTQSTTDSSQEPTSVLRGVVFEEGEHRAYFEALPGATIQRVGVGDELGKGRVAEIVIDAVLYEFDGQTLWIEMGHDLSGARAPLVPVRGAGGTPVASASTAGGPTTAPGGEPGADVDPSALSLEERMRLRRQERR